MAEEAFAFDVVASNEGPVVRLRGELDLSVAAELRQCLHELAGQSIVVDFNNVTSIDSTAISVLVAAYRRRLHEGSGEITLHGVQRAQMRLFEMTGLDGY